MPRLPDPEFAQAWRDASNLDELARAVGMSKAAASSRASRMRSEGRTLPKFPVGRKARAGLPVALQVARWEWVRVKGGRVEHRRRPGQPVALCARIVPPGSEVVGRGLRPCPSCWPVAEHPPSRGPIPPDVVAAVVQVGPDRALLAHRPVPGPLRDVETDEPVADDLEPLAWWSL